MFNRVKTIPWQAWFYDRDPKGCPVDVMALCDTSLVDQAKALASKWLNGGKDCTEKDIDGWTSQSKLIFLQEIQSLDNLETLKKIDKMYHFSDVKHSELRFAWLMLSVKLKDESCLKNVEDMLLIQGRMKFTRPLYKELAKYNRDLALRIFSKGNYHPICEKMVKKDLGI